MLGALITGFEDSGLTTVFNAVIGLALVAAYCLLGAGWLIIESEGALQLQTVRWARASLIFTMASIVAISIARPMVSHSIFLKWFSFPNMVLLLPISAATAGFFTGLLWLGLQPVSVAGH
jgi:cytochrome d ubiquinol oxidase subunit II